MQVRPDYTMLIIDKEFKSNFGLDFKGPGLYTTPTSTMVVCPTTAPVGTEWHYAKVKGSTYDVLVWDCPVEDTIMYIISSMPAIQ